jgi:hypothetical protein
MSMTVRRRTAHCRLRLAALLLPAGLLLTACGVPASGVVPAGDSATGIGQNTMLYFISRDTLTALPDDRGPSTDLKAALAYRAQHADPVQFAVELAVWLLADGPGDAYRAKGVASEFPANQQARPHVATTGSAVTVELPPWPRPLSDLATRQLLCTAAAAFLTASPDTEPAELTVKVSGHAVWRADAFDETCS